MRQQALPEDFDLRRVTAVRTAHTAVVTGIEARDRRSALRRAEPAAPGPGHRHTAQRQTGLHVSTCDVGGRQKIVAAYSANGLRTPFDSVTCPNSGLPFIFSISAAIPP
jgi:hypothetical protein